MSGNCSTIVARQGHSGLGPAWDSLSGVVAEQARVGDGLQRPLRFRLQPRLTRGGKQRYEKEPDDHDMRMLEKIEGLEWPQRFL